MKNPTNKKQLIAHIRTDMEETINLDEIQQDKPAIKRITYAFASDDANRLFGMEYFSSNVQEAFWLNWGFAGILSTIEERMAFLSSHAEINTPAPIIGNVSVTNGIAHITAYDVDEVQ